MCHRFNLTTSPDMVAKFLESFSVTILPELLPSKDYYPIYDVLTLRMIDDDQWTLEPRSWGFLPRAWKPTDKVRTRKSFQRGKINARSETVDTTWPWKFAFPSQRCVMLAGCFYEPSRNGGDNRYSLLGHNVFCMAGLWDHYEGDDGKGTRESIDNCVMLTTDANALVASTRKGRMRQPVLLTEVADIERYCSLEVTEHAQIADLFTPWPDDQMRCAADSP
jgi:putative SOS response-associated peptidase YedK